MASSDANTGSYPDTSSEANGSNSGVNDVYI